MKYSELKSSTLQERLATHLKALGEQIRVTRLTAKITQRELASKMGMDQNNISLYEKGKIDISIGRLMQLEEALGTKSGFFLYFGHELVLDSTSLQERQAAANAPADSTRNPFEEEWYLRILAERVAKINADKENTQVIDKTPSEMVQS